MSDFESELAKTPLRGAPADWRAEILRAARAVAPEAATPPWWRRWLAPQPLTLAAAWLVIATLWLATPANSETPRRADMTQMKAQVRAQRELLAELLRPAAPVPAAPSQQGATGPRRKHLPA